MGTCEHPATLYWVESKVSFLCRQRITVLLCALFEPPVFHTEPYCPIRIGDYNHRARPLGVGSPYDIRVHLVSDLFVDQCP